MSFGDEQWQAWADREARRAEEPYDLDHDDFPDPSEPSYDDN